MKRQPVEEPAPVRRRDLPIAPHPDTTSGLPPVTVTMPGSVYVWLREIVGAKYRNAHSSGHYRTMPGRWRVVNEAYDVFAEPEEQTVDVVDRPVKKIIKKATPPAAVNGKKILKRR